MNKINYGTMMVFINTLMDNISKTEDGEYKQGWIDCLMSIKANLNEEIGGQIEAEYSEKEMLAYTE